MTIKLSNPQEVEAYKANWLSHTGEEMAIIYGVSRKTISSINQKLGIQKVKYREYVKREPRKRGPEPDPIGTIYTFNSKKGVKNYIRTEQGRIRLHIYNWLAAGNTIPEGYVLAFKEIKEPEDCSVENLCLMTRGQVAVRYRKNILTPEERVIKRKEWSRRKETPEEKQKRSERERAKWSAKKAERMEQKRIRKEARRAELEKIRAEREKIKQQEKREAERLKAAQKITRRVLRENKRVKQVEKSYKTRTLDLSEKIPIRIDRKTIVYVNPGSDIEAIKLKYSKAS